MNNINHTTTDQDTEPTVIFGYDRIILYTDHPEVPSALVDRLEKHCTSVVARVEQMPFQARWKSKLDVFQPTARGLGILNKSLGNNITAQLYYVEIACDAPANSEKQALEWRKKFLESARMRSQGQPVVCDKSITTYYYGRRTTEKGTRRPNVLAVYADKPSKINNAKPDEGMPPCLHIEWRATGVNTLARYGIVSLTDLIQFGHEQFWGKHVRMHLLPKPTELGRLLAKVCGDDPNVSGSALRKRAARWKEKYTIDGNFIMHNACMPNALDDDKKNLVRHLKSVTFSEWLKETILL